jgi:hypothetical protein
MVHLRSFRLNSRAKGLRKHSKIIESLIYTIYDVVSSWNRFQTLGEELTGIIMVNERYAIVERLVFNYSFSLKVILRADF